MFIAVNSLSLVFILVSYLKMLQAIRGSGEAMRSTLSGRENAVARRYALVRRIGMRHLQGYAFVFAQVRRHRHDRLSVLVAGDIGENCRPGR